MKSPAAPLPASSAQHLASERADKYLSFRLGKEEFAVQVLLVREILGMQPITVVPQTPAHVKGLMNLRGKPVPVIDLRLKLGMPDSEPTPRTSIVVVQMETDGVRVLIGLLVDGVSEVLMLKPADIESASRSNNGELIPYLLGTAKVKGRVRFLLDMPLVL